MRHRPRESRPGRGWLPVCGSSWVKGAREPPRRASQQSGRAYCARAPARSVDARARHRARFNKKPLRSIDRNPARPSQDAKQHLPADHRPSTHCDDFPMHCGKAVANIKRPARPAALTCRQKFPHAPLQRAGPKDGSGGRAAVSSWPSSPRDDHAGRCTLPYAVRPVLRRAVLPPASRAPQSTRKAGQRSVTLPVRPRPPPRPPFAPPRRWACHRRRSPAAVRRRSRRRHHSRSSFRPR